MLNSGISHFRRHLTSDELCLQVASRALGIDASQIFISETATDKVPNASATAASAGSDLNGMAVMVCNNFSFLYSTLR